MQPEASAARSFIGSSPKIREIMAKIENMADGRWPVLIEGETGTGKELIARRVHTRSSSGPFIVIDCSAIPANLMESELFGHVKGSFTGASNAKTGLIELANGGSAFFDEIGELPLDLQSKLLRVLQEKEFRPVGSTQPRRSDFCAIAATNRNLREEADKGTFRRDLLYRLKVITLRLPPLRERREDIPVLIEHFLARYGHRHEIAPEAMHALQEYDWPGNVRELENCVQHMVAVNGGLLLQKRDMPSTVINQAVLARTQLMGLAAAVGASGPDPVAELLQMNDMEPILPLPEVEKREILRALQHTKGDRTAAAALLHIGRTTLYRKLREYGVEV